MLKEDGSYYGKRGNQLERILVQDFSSIENYNKYKKGLRSNSIYDLVLNRIILNNKIRTEEIINLSATNKVPSLGNRGNPKTDIVLTIESQSGRKYLETISVKYSKMNKVSCHEYSVIDFIRVLKCSGTKLANYLSIFQDYPSYRAFEQNLPEGYSLGEFVILLNKKENIFNEWVLTGNHDSVNLVHPELQISKYLLIHNENKYAFYTMKEYIDLIKKKRTSERFGVPFSWTYPSKRRGKRIQLKVPILFEEENSIEISY